MNQQEVIDTVKKLVVQTLEIEDALCQPAMVLEQQGATEFDLIELMMRLEQEFCFIGKHDEHQDFITVQSVIDYVQQKKR